MKFKKWVKSIKTAGYNGARTVITIYWYREALWMYKKVQYCQVRLYFDFFNTWLTVQNLITGFEAYLSKNTRLVTWRKEQDSENVLRFWLHYSLTIFGTISRVCLQGTMIAKRNDLCAIQDNFNVFVKETKIKHSKVMKKTKLLLLVCLCFFLNKVFAAIAQASQMQEFISNESRPGFWAIVIAVWVCLFLICCIALQAMMIYLQLSCNVMKSIQEICLDCSTKKKILENTAELLKSLKITSKFISWYCFYLTVLFILILIFHVYLLFDLLTGSSTHWCSIISDVIQIVASTLGLWILNVQSEEVQQSLKDLKEKIQNLVVDDTNFVEINGVQHNEKYARKIVIKMLDEFNGFDVIGFFNLGKPLLFSIAIKIMEFLFVLISLHLSIKWNEF